MQNKSKIFDEIVHKRRSVRIYDKDADFDADAVRRSLERAILAPNSSNLQLWEFYRVKSKDKVAELAKYCLGQKAATTANELIVFVTRKDKWKKHAKAVLDNAKKDFPDKIGKKEQLLIDYYEKVIPTLYFTDPLDIISALKKVGANVGGFFQPLPKQVTATDVRIVVHKSCALAAQTFMLSMASEGFDSCPMEGFDSDLVHKFLKLPKAAEICMIVSVGKGKPEGFYGDRFRVPANEVIFEI